MRSKHNTAPEPNGSLLLDQTYATCECTIAGFTDHDNRKRTLVVTVDMDNYELMVYDTMNNGLGEIVLWHP